jgi:hypothetical protein
MDAQPLCILFAQLGEKNTSLDKWSCFILLHKAALFACGSMVLADHLCALFPHVAREKCTP